MGKSTLDLKTVGECNRCLGCTTLHPQVTLINLEKPGVQEDAVKFEFYAILLIEECADCSSCGRRYYDYANATMVFLKPGEVFSMSRRGTLPDHGWLLAFHPDLLSCTSLQRDMANYTFFDYRKEEALHLSQRETETITCCLENIEDELHHAIDRHSATILSRHIELMLDYCARYYERQFITRENKNKAIIARFARMADECITSGRLHGGRMLSPSWFATDLGLSEAYFADLLKFETGKTLAAYVQLRQMELAKRMLLDGGCTAVDVARRLGFASVQLFSSVFKRLTGVAPNDYRLANN